MSGKGKIAGLALTKTIWPVLCQVLAQYGKDATVVEKAVKLIEQCLRCLPEHCRSILYPLTELLISDFERNGHSSYLYCLEQLVCTYGRESIRTTDTRHNVVTTLRETFIRLAQISVQRFHRNSDDLLALGADFLRLSGRFLQHASNTVLDDTTLPSLL